MLLEFYGPRYALFKGENKPLNLEQILAEHPDRREKVLAHLKDTSVAHLLLPPPTTTSLPPPHYHHSYCNHNHNHNHHYHHNHPLSFLPPRSWEAKTIDIAS
jgi:hypothetical protein